LRSQLDQGGRLPSFTEARTYAEIDPTKQATQFKIKRNLQAQIDAIPEKLPTVKIIVRPTNFRSASPAHQSLARCTQTRARSDALEMLSGLFRNIVILSFRTKNHQDRDDYGTIHGRRRTSALGLPSFEIQFNIEEWSQCPGGGDGMTLEQWQAWHEAGGSREGFMFWTASGVAIETDSVLLTGRTAFQLAPAITAFERLQAEIGGGSGHWGLKKSSEGGVKGHKLTRGAAVVHKMEDCE
jgi:hypothetical protein